MNDILEFRNRSTLASSQSSEGCGSQERIAAQRVATHQGRSQAIETASAKRSRAQSAEVPPVAQTKAWAHEGEFLQTQLRLPIGQRLVDAELISTAQLELVLKDQKAQKRLKSDYYFGEIVVLRNWLSRRTIEFFLNLAHEVTPEFRRQPLGQKLKQADLVTDIQLQRALKDQRRIQTRIGCILFLNEVVNAATIDYFQML